MINQHKNYFKKIPSPKFFKFKNRSLANEKQKERERGGEKKKYFILLLRSISIHSLYIPPYINTSLRYNK